MNFNEALNSLKSGKSVRRSSYVDIRMIRFVDPSVDKASDGPDNVWLLLFQGKPYSKFGKHETREAAESAFEELKEAHKTAWKAYNTFRSRYDGASLEERKAWPPEKKVPAPQLPRDAYDGEEFQIAERPAPRKYRINTPFLVRVMKDGTVEPHTITNSDLTAADWKVA